VAGDPTRSRHRPEDPPLDPDLDTHARHDATKTIVGAIRGGVLDTELAALVWLLLDGGVPLVVAGPGGDAMARGDRSDVLAALLNLLPPTRQPRRLGGDQEDFAWLGPAEALGWRRVGPADAVPADPAATVILAGELGSAPTADTTGDRARLVVRAIGAGFALAGTMEAARLEDVLATLRRRPIGLADDELSSLGVVAILGDRPVGPPRIATAHYLRPLARDVHGHTRRLPPAVLAVWDDRSAHFEHFAWGVATELAARVGRRAGDFEGERERRAAVLSGLEAIDPDGPDGPSPGEIRAALELGRIGGPRGGGRHGD
jgi:hypothetical protein